MCKLRVTKCPICGHGMKCDIDGCDKVRLAGQTCGERQRVADKVSAQMCDKCYKNTKSVRHKAKNLAKKAMGGGSSSSQQPARPEPNIQHLSPYRLPQHVEQPPSSTHRSSRQDPNPSGGHRRNVSLAQRPQGGLASATMWSQSPQPASSSNSTVPLPSSSGSPRQDQQHKRKGRHYGWS